MCKVFSNVLLRTKTLFLLRSETIQSHDKKCKLSSDNGNFFSTLKCEMFHVTNQLSVVKCISKVEINSLLKKTFPFITVITLAPIESF